MTNTNTQKNKQDWERLFKKFGWRECVALVFRRLYPVTDLDVDPPVTHLKTNANLDLEGSEEDILDIIELAFHQQEQDIRKEEREKIGIKLFDWFYGDIDGEFVEDAIERITKVPYEGRTKHEERKKKLSTLNQIKE